MKFSRFIFGALALSAFGSAHAARFVIGPIDNQDDPDTVNVIVGDMVTMSSNLSISADRVYFEVRNQNGDTVFAGSVTPNGAGTAEFLWFPTSDGTFRVTATSFVGDVQVGQEQVALVTSTRPDASGFITGGGWFTLGPNRDNFGFVAQVLGNGNIRGNLEFQDRTNGKNIKSNSLNWVWAPDPFNGYFSGLARINGEGSHPFTVHVIDNGEPGTDDWFSLWVYDPSGATLLYSYSNTLVGGNIQVHSR